MVPYAQELSILPDPTGEKNHQNIVVNNVRVRCFREDI